MNSAKPTSRISAYEIRAFAEPQSKRTCGDWSAWAPVLSSWIVTLGFATVLIAASAPCFAGDGRVATARVSEPAGISAQRPSAPANKPASDERRYWPGDFDHGCNGPWDAQGRQIGMSVDRPAATAASERR